MSLLDARRVTVSYGRIAAVQDVSLTVAEGQVVTIVGPNGAGKTTLLSALMGLLPMQGEVAYFGAPGRRSTEALVAAGMGLIPETRALFGSMSVADNLALGGWRATQDRSGEVFALFPRLAERRQQHAATLSGGERAMLAMGRALMAGPRLLLLDEPSLGLAPLVMRDIFRAIAALRDRGVAVLLVEQNARAALRIADQAHVMEAGRFVLSGPATELARNARVIEAYLGVSVGQNPTEA
jgi:branched-chain amino acid transport system ATP-binding protein